MHAIEMKMITKKFPPSTVALENTSLSVRKGEIHCLLGENGAGKTTLMNILYGIFRPDSGEIYVDSKPVEISSPKDAIELGIGMVHQHFLLVEPNSVAENIALGHPSSSLIFPQERIKSTIVSFSEKYGLAIDPDAKIWQISAGERQRVEILKVLSRKPRVLILDEPTSILTPQETKDLFKALRTIVKEGLTIIFITHKLDEVIALDGRVSVLRKGKVVRTLNVTETNKRELVRLMVGRDVLLRLERPKVRAGKPVLKIDGLCALNNRGLQALDDVTLYAREGEILGVAGVAGNGQTELIEVITGLRDAASGKVTILDKDVTNHTSKYVADIGVAHIPEERMRRGLFGGLTVAENLIIGNHQDETFSNGIFLKNDAIQKHANRLIEEYNIATSGPNTPAKYLSGGNVQRLILAKKLSGKPKLIIASHPTSGLDVAATEQIRKRLLEEQKRGAAIILFSEDLNELFELSNRMTVMYRGRIMGTFNTNEVRIEEVGMMMTGNKK